jgi:hypothetical protein
LRIALAVGAVVAASVLIGIPSPQAQNMIVLPPGVTVISREWWVPSGTTVRGHDSGSSIVRAAADFQGRALFRVRSAHGVRFEAFGIDGNRPALERRTGLPPYDVPFSRFTSGNGILAEDATGLTVSSVAFKEIAGFAVLAARSRDVSIDRISVESSGSRNQAGRNNATGGVLIEGGTSNFKVTASRFRSVLGNAVWTHSRAVDRRNGPGTISRNRFENIGRDAIQIGHATEIMVDTNTGRRIGYPVDAVDVEGHAIPVALDTAGNVDRSMYRWNRFEEVNGKCIDLDGFHDGEVRANRCLNAGPPQEYPHGGYAIVMNNSNPDMRPEGVVIEENRISGWKFGGIFMIGTRNRVVANRLLNLNTAQCETCYYTVEEPDLLRSGIYLGKGAERPAPAHRNIVRDNVITGYQMDARCIAAAPGVELQANEITRNLCRKSLSAAELDRLDSVPDRIRRPE